MFLGVSAVTSVARRGGTPHPVGFCTTLVKRGINMHQNNIEVDDLYLVWIGWNRYPSIGQSSPPPRTLDKS